MSGHLYDTSNLPKRQSVQRSWMVKRVKPTPVWVVGVYENGNRTTVLDRFLTQHYIYEYFVLFGSI